jgi:hypothetical protein
VLRNLSDAKNVTNQLIRELAELRLRQLEHLDQSDAFGQLIVVEAGDAVEQLENEIGLPILRSLFDDHPFYHPDFSPCFEFMEKHQDEEITVYEAFYLASDSGVGTTLFISEGQGIEEDLLAMCRSWATPAVSQP